jgi:hypothetical protein
MRLKNLLYEYFHITNLEEANIAEMKRVLVFTSIDDQKIEVRHYEIPLVAESDVL